MLRFLRDASTIRRKVVFYGATVGAILVLFSGLTLAFQEWTFARQRLERELFLVGDLIASNSVAAVVFNDSTAAEATLSSLQYMTDIETAVLYSESGAVVASFTKAGVSLGVPTELPTGRRSLIFNDAAEVYLPLNLDGARVGTLYLRSATSRFILEMRQRLLMMAVLFLGAIILAVLAGIPLQRSIVRPIAALTRVSEDISARKNYSLRAPIMSKDEIGSLAASFNTMLDQIQARDEAIRRGQARLREVNAELRASNAELSEFAHIASHDLQEPLRKIQTFGDRLRTRHQEELSESARHYLERMHDAAGRMRNLIEDLLSLSRVMAHKAPFEEVDLNLLFDELKGDLEEAIAENRAEVSVGVLPVIEGDHSQLYRLFQNLLGNSLKYYRPGVPPKVTIRSEELSEQGIVQITQEDNGIGFLQEYATQIFKPFQRLHSREEYPGTGIGLAICRKIVQRHGGKIWAEGSLGKGAKFVIQLPKKSIKETEEHSGAKV